MKDQQLDEILRMARLTAGKLKGTITPEEEADLAQWVARNKHNHQLFGEMQDEEYRSALLADMDRPDAETALVKMRARIKRYEKRRRRTQRRWRYSIAAAMVLLGGGASYFFLQKKPSPAPVPSLSVSAGQQDILPGRNGAILTLSDGSRITLDSLGNGIVARQGSTKAVLSNGSLSYTAEHGTAGKIGYNTMTTPRGRQFRLVLPDGSRVWLNAASSIRYPTIFTAGERSVEVTGEAYFEVAPDEEAPFKVEVNGTTEIEVLGTDFNVSAYPDEPDIRTTLLKGSVKVTGGKENRALVMRPGQQTVVAPGEDISLLKNVNVSRTLAWKEGRFEFSGNIRDIMRQIARWYDVEVVYEGDVSDRAYGGAISKYENVSRVLEMLELTGSIHFKIEKQTASGRAKITVRP
ncbi:FecR family protein [Compostibacter hankyongensis]|uniref:DUF4974 domain-containing protein n=1 Tax=Compostibacter hankyongensis TaxID=1007089 RepID=A0ABP8FL04_9BACT